MSIISSSFESVIDLTPWLPRPVARTSLSLKRMHLPSREAIKISSSPLDISVPIRLSPSSNVIAIFPFLFMRSNSDRSVFLISPFFVAMMRLPFASSPRGMIVVTFSSASSAIRLTMLLPFAVRCASGTSYALIAYTLPFVVKNSKSSCEDVMNICST